MIVALCLAKLFDAWFSSSWIEYWFEWIALLWIFLSRRRPFEMYCFDFDKPYFFFRFKFEMWLSLMISVNRDHNRENVAEKYSKWLWNCSCFSGIWTRHLWRREQSLYQLGHITLKSILSYWQAWFLLSKQAFVFLGSKHVWLRTKLI